MYKCILALVYAFYSIGCFADQTHAASKMLTPPPAKKESQVTSTLIEKRQQVLTKFSASYEIAGEPGIAVFWNREFDDQLSQWYQTFRTSQTGESSIKGKDKFEPAGGDDPAYERNVSGGGKIVSAQYVEVRDKVQSRAGFNNESKSFGFSAGFTSAFLSVPAKILDRKAIMRLVQRDGAKEAGAEMISDYQKVETDALVGYAEYLAEILLTPDQSGDSSWAFMVTVKSVSTGQVVAMFKSTANKPFDEPQETRWVATSTGYQKETDERKIGTPEEVGQQLAYETMQALSKIWK
jgi:hypothetical protein